MQYTREVLDRKTGELLTISLGDRITIAELGEMHSLGRRQTTDVLRHLDVLQVETTDRTTRHRLAPWFVERGYGRRLKRRTDKFPFDVGCDLAVYNLQPRLDIGLTPREVCKFRRQFE